MEDYLIAGVLLPTGDAGYGKFDVHLSGGKIEKVSPSTGPVEDAGKAKVIDGTNKMLLPGFVNAHTHSIEQWGRGSIMQLPLELWVEMLYQKCDPRSDPNCPSHMVYMSALHIGVETIMTGGTAIMDHLFCRNLEDVEAAVKAYKQLGIRAYIAPMLGDLERTNYFPLVENAEELNGEAKKKGGCCEGLGPEGIFRTELPPRDPEQTKRVMDLWTASVEKFHDPEAGINIAIGPVQNWSASDELIEESIALRKKHNLCGHIHLLESRAQKLHSRKKYPNGGAVKKLFDLGWLSLPGTSCAHCVWLEDHEQKLMAQAGAVVVHNPISNTRLGSGIAPLREYRDNGVTVAIGCDGSCSNDGQDMLEAIKLSCILNPLTTPEYRKWVTPREVLRMASEGGAVAIGMEGQVGEIKEGYEADVVLYDLTTLSMLPRTDPVGLLVLGRPSAGPGGNTVHSVWVKGKLVLEDGVPKGVDLAEFRQQLIDAKPAYIDPAITDPTGTPFEKEYRAAMGLEGPLQKEGAGSSPVLSNYPQHRVCYPADLA